MHIHVSIDYVPKQVGWSACYCQYCQQVEAARYDEIFEVVKIFFVPVRREFNQHGGRCDLCELPVTDWLIEKSLPLESWSPQEGFASLFAKLEMPPDIPIPSVDADSRLHSLLRSIEERCAINGMDVRVGLVHHPA